MKIQAVKSKSTLLIDRYKQIRNRVNKLNLRLKRKYFSEIISECHGDLKRSWKNINQVINKSSKTTAVPSLSVEGESIKDNKNIDSGSLDAAVGRWSDTLSQIIDKHAPLREKRVSERFCPWITPELKKICRTRDKLKIAAVKSNSELLMSAYKHMRCKANNLKQSLKTQYFTNKLRSCEGNIKETWKTMNQVINKRSKTTNIKLSKKVMKPSLMINPLPIP